MRKQLRNIAYFAAANLLVAANAFADAAAAPSESTGLLAIGAGIGMSIAVFGGVLAQGKAVAAALDSIGRNPSAAGKVLTPMLIGLALIESLVILGFVICNSLVGKI